MGQEPPAEGAYNQRLYINTGVPYSRTVTTFPTPALPHTLALVPESAVSHSSKGRALAALLFPPATSSDCFQPAIVFRLLGNAFTLYLPTTVSATPGRRASESKRSQMPLPFSGTQTGISLNIRFPHRCWKVITLAKKSVCSTEGMTVYGWGLQGLCLCAG